MYQRYEPPRRPASSNASKPPLPKPQEPEKAPPKTPPPHKKIKLTQNPLHQLLPPSLYNPQTKKIFGVLSSEDLLLIALIFLVMENEEEKDPMTALALLYLLLCEYIDLPL